MSVALLLLQEVEFVLHHYAISYHHSNSCNCLLLGCAIGKLVLKNYPQPSIFYFKQIIGCIALSAGLKIPNQSGITCGRVISIPVDSFDGSLNGNIVGGVRKKINGIAIGEGTHVIATHYHIAPVLIIRGTAFKDIVYHPFSIVAGKIGPA